MNHVRSRLLAWGIALLLVAAPAPGWSQPLVSPPEGVGLWLAPEMHIRGLASSAVDAAERHVVTGGFDGAVRVWSLADGRLLRHWFGDGSPIAVAISPDGAHVAVAGASDSDFHIAIHDRETGGELHRIDGLPNWVLHLVYAPDGRHLAAVMRHDATGLRVYETADYREVARDENYGAGSEGAAFDAAGRLATTSFDGHVRLYDAGFARIGRASALFDRGTRSLGPFGIAFSSDGRRLAFGYHDLRRVDILDADTLELAASLTLDAPGAADLRHVAWSPDGRYLWAGTSTADGPYAPQLVRWSADDLSSAVTFDMPAAAAAVVHPLGDGRLVAASRGLSGMFLALVEADGTPVWERLGPTLDFRVISPAQPVQVSADGTVMRFAYDPDGRRPAQFSVRTGTVETEALSEAGTAPPQTTAPWFSIGDWWNGIPATIGGVAIGLRERPVSWAVVPQARQVVVGEIGWLHLFGEGEEPLWSSRVPGIPWSVNVSGDGRLVVVTVEDGTIRWYDRRSGVELLVFYPHSDGERWVAWTPEGFHVASPGAADLLGYRVFGDAGMLGRVFGGLWGGDDAPLLVGGGQVRDILHRPDLVARSLDADRSAITQAAAELGDLAARLRTIARDGS